MGSHATATRLARRLTARDLDSLPHEWDTLYELIGGVLFMSRKPPFDHQEIIARLLLEIGSAVNAAGGSVVQEPGIVWEDGGDDNVAPDLVILLRTPRPTPGEKLRRCPEVVVEVVSQGDENRHRDLVAKRDLYWRRDAVEYWIVDPANAEVRRLTRGRDGWVEEVLRGHQRLASPLLPGWKGIEIAYLLLASRA